MLKRFSMAAAVAAFVGMLTGCGLSNSTRDAVRGPGSVGSDARGGLTGLAYGGQNPISGGSVYLYAANITTPGSAGYGAASVSLLKSGGNPVVPITDPGGFFDITGLYACPTPANTPVYLLITGGDPGLGTGTNPNLAIMVVLGSCDTLLANAATTFVNVNEVTTVAATYALSGFMSSATHLGTSSTNVTGLNNAFATAAALANTSVGMANAVTPAGNATVPQDEINALADAIASCVNSSGGSASENGGSPTTNCGKLFAATSNGSAPADTVQALLNLAHAPDAHAEAILDLVTGIGAPFSTTLSSVHDWMIGLNYTGGGLSTPQGVAIDAAGNAWVANAGNTVTKISGADGIYSSGSSGYTSSSLDAPTSIAIDTAGNAWLTNCGRICSGSANPGSIIKLTPSGNNVTANNYTDASFIAPYAIALDGANSVYVANTYGNSIAKLNSSGVVQSGSGITTAAIAYPVALASDANNVMWSLSPAKGDVVSINTDQSIHSSLNGSGVNYPVAAAFDHTNRIWVANKAGNSVTVFSNAGSPVIAGYTGGGLSTPEAIALDGNQTAWVANASNSISAIANGGTAISGNTGYTAAAGYTATPLAYPNGIAVDGSGNVWITNCGSYCTGSGTNAGSVTELVGAATPVVTPLAVGVANSTLAVKP